MCAPKPRRRQHSAPGERVPGKLPTCPPRTAARAGTNRAGATLTHQGTPALQGELDCAYLMIDVGPRLRCQTMDLDPVLLARLQFGFTIAFHIIFPSFTIGLSAYIAT